MENQTVTENIDEKILNLIGIDDTFDLDYDEYDTLLKEAIVKKSFGENKLDQEDLAILSNERKRIRDKKQLKFTSKKTKINTSNFSNLKILKKPENLNIQKIEKKPEENFEILEVLVRDVTDINQTLTNILSNITEQNRIQEETSEEERRRREDERRKKKESRLESVLKPIKKAAEKLLAPVQGILNRIIKFILFTLLGRAFKMFMDWTKDPKNQEKIKSLGRFLKDWWPILLGAWFFFANPLGIFIRTIVGTIAKLTFQLAKFAIPRLLSFIAKNPYTLAIGAIVGTAAIANEITGQRKAAPVQVENKAKAQTGKGLGVQGVGGVGDLGPTTPYGLLQPLSLGGITGFGKYKNGYSSGGNIFSGLVGKEHGVSVSGAGPDTQFFPVEGGGGAVLQPGETVLQVGARERIIKETGVDPLSYNVGPGANIPRRLNNNLIGNSFGGLIGMKTGGVVGGGKEVNIAMHNLMQDEALSSLKPGVNDFTRPGMPSWSKVNKNTPIYSYLDSEKVPTIGWGSTFYDSILSGKKKVKLGDKITKQKADDIFKTNLLNLSKAYSSEIPHWNKMSDNQRAGVLVMGYNAPYGPIGAYQNLTRSLKEGNMMEASKHLQRSGPNAKRIELERSLFLSGPPNVRNLVGPKVVGEKKVGSGIPGIPPFLYNMKQMFGNSKGNSDEKFQKGGEIGESTGSDYAPDGNRLEGADRQYIPGFFVQPGETHYIFTKQATERGASGLADLIQARLDPNSSAAKRTIPGPPVRRRGMGSTTVLPPITQKSGSNLRVSSRLAPNLPNFSTVSTAAYETRIKNAELYGIM